MQTFENTVTIQRPAEEVFAFLADFENIPKWNYAIEETQQGFRWARRSGNQIPPDPLGAEQERRGLRGDRLRASPPAGHSRADRALPGTGSATSWRQRPARQG